MNSREFVTDILIIDDQPEPLLNPEKMVLPPYSRPISVPSVEQALQQVATQPFATILINATARPGSAFELAQRLRAQAPQTPLIFVLPAGANWPELSKGHTLPLLDYLTAPVDPQLLQTRIHAMAALYQQTRQPLPVASRDSKAMSMFSTLAETTSAAIFIFQGIAIKYVNRAAVTLTGFSKPELLNMNFWDVLHPNVRETLRQEGLDRQQHIKNYNPRMETRLLTKAGHTRWIDVTLGRFEFDDQPAIMGTAFDITDRKQAEKVRQFEKDVTLYFRTTPLQHKRLDFILSLMLQLTPFDCGGIYLLDEESGSLNLVAHQGLSATFIKAVEHLAPDDPRLWMIKQGRPIYQPVAQLPHADLRLMAQEDIQFVAIIPILGRDEIIGTFNLATHTAVSLDRLDLEFIQIIAATTLGPLVAYAKVEESLKVNEARYRTILNDTSSVITRFLPGGILTYVNKACCDLYGKSEDELIGASFLQSIPADERDFVEGMFSSLTPENPSVTYEHSVFGKNGQRYFHQWTDRAIFDDQGRLIALQSAGEDITAYKQTEAALRHSEEKYRNIFYNSPLGIVHFNKDSVITDCNQKFIEIIGSSKKALLGLNMLRQLKNHKLTTQIEAALQGGEGYYEGDYRSVTAGKITPVRVHLKGINNEIGEIVSGVGLVEDVTESKKAEIRFARFMDHFPGLAFIDDRNGYIVYCNQHYAQRFNDIPANIIGKHFSELYPPDQAALFVQENLSVLSENRTLAAEFTFDRDGQRSHWLTIKFPIEVEPYPLLGAISLNITDKVRLEQETEQLQLINQANAELARAARLKDEFLANMSHELRTPLHAILGKAEVLQEGVYGPLTEEQRNSLQILEESGRHLLALINDVLDLSKIEAGKMEIYVDNVPVREICEASLRIVKQLANSKRLRVTVNLDNNVTEIKTDMRRLKQMLVNLLSNAVKFTPDEGEIGLNVVGDAGNQAVNFTVWDTGIGIAPEEMKRLFQPFTQLDSGLNRAYGGTGLGLSLVARLAEMQAGSVSVESAPGKGSRFTVTLPWQPVSAAAAPPPSDSPVVSNTAEAASTHKALILLVEDNEANIVATSEYLGAFGYSVAVARNGLAALKAVDDMQPDLILMDIQMPEMDGLEAIGRIRGIETMQEKPIIALTALAMPGDKERCLEAGANAYVSKPVSLKKLIRTIEALLNGNLN